MQKLCRTAVATAAADCWLCPQRMAALGIAANMWTFAEIVYPVVRPALKDCPEKHPDEMSLSVHNVMRRLKLAQNAGTAGLLNEPESSGRS
jgi:hypothetical protein